MTATNLAMTVAFEAAEPDDLLPVALPLDDLARKGIIKLGREAGEEAAERSIGEVLEEGTKKVARGGTYKLIDPVTEEVRYVGRSKDLTRRAAQHKLDPHKRTVKI